MKTFKSTCLDRERDGVMEHLTYNEATPGTVTIVKRVHDARGIVGSPKGVVEMPTDTALRDIEQRIQKEGWSR